MILWGGLVCAMTIGAPSAQLLNEILRGAVNDVPTDLFNCRRGVEPCGLTYRVYSAVDPSEINGPANPVDGIPRYIRVKSRYISNAVTTANYPVSGGALAGNEWYVAWDGITGAGTTDHAGWYGAQSQVVNFSEIGNSLSFNCLPVLAQEACFAALDVANASNDTVRADGTPLTHVGGISPIPCPTLTSNTVSSLSYSWEQAANSTSRDGAGSAVTGTTLYLLPDPTAAATDGDLAAGAVAVASLGASDTSATLDKATLTATAGLIGSTIYSAALKVDYAGGLSSTQFSCNSELSGTAALPAAETGDAPSVVDTQQVLIEQTGGLGGLSASATSAGGFMVVTLRQGTNQVTQNQIHYELFFDTNLDGTVDESMEIFGFPSSASRNKAGVSVLLRFTSTFDAGTWEADSSLDDATGRVQFVIAVDKLQAALGSSFGLSGNVKRPGGNRDAWDAGVVTLN
ncbi:MAG: hypothetical protein ACE5IK_06400 [Acidobacteriota bacterium]